MFEVWVADLISMVFGFWAVITLRIWGRQEWKPSLEPVQPRVVALPGVARRGWGRSGVRLQV